MIELVIQQRRRDLGSFEVGRVLPFAKRRMVGPYIFFDRMGPKDLDPGLPREADVRPHPHIGLSTITYLFDGEITHRDSLASEQAIRPGEVNWMTAGRGIVHSERTPDRLRGVAHAMHGLQTWVALPEGHEEDAPAFAHHPASTLPRLERGGARLHVVAGHAFGERSPVRVLADTLYVAIDLPAGTSLAIPDEHAERALYPVAGEAFLDDEPLPANHLAFIDAPGGRVLRATTDARLMLLGGEPLGHRFVWWNFVSSSRERIERAKDDWRAQRLGAVPGETGFIPLPER